MTSTYTVNWGFEAIRYVGYMVIGNCIYERYHNKKRIFTRNVYLLDGILGFILLGWVYGKVRVNGLEAFYGIIDSLSFPVIVFSIMLFAGISNIESGKMSLSTGFVG